jgi:hypothetical protein
MRLNGMAGIGLALVAASYLSGCDKLGLDKLGLGDSGAAAGDDGAPAEEQLRKISYMSAEPAGPKGRKVYNHPEQAKTCEDLELAMRWNRPPNVAGGPFHKKMLYVGGQLPPELPKDTEVFITARIERGEVLPSGDAVWLLRMKEGPTIQAVESTNFWQKQEQDSQLGKTVAIVRPTKPGRAFCGHGVYQGPIAKQPGGDEHIPLVSMLYSMDRDG